MKRLNLLACCLFLAPAAFGQYSYWYNETFNPSYSSNWTVNGTVTTHTTGLGDTSSSSAGSLISTLTIPNNPPETAGSYEVKTTLNLSASGGTYVTYLDATSNALITSGSATGTFYAVEFTPTFTGSICSLSINIYKSLSGTVTSLASGTAACSSTTAIRTVRAWNWFHVYVNAIDSLWAYDTDIANGQAGVGVAGAGYPNTIASANLGEIIVVSPYPVDPTTIGTSAVSNEVDIQWQGTTDGPGGSGLSDYSLYRGSTWLGLMPASQTSFADTTVSPSTTYTYTLYAVSYDLLAASTTFNVTTPPAGSIEPRRPGVRPTGAYWGANPEQLDVLSGNLNFSLPVLKTQARSSGVGFSLTYNSQNWRKDSGGIWNLGADVGYGYGWKLLAGSITPHWSGSVVDHYVFTDATGAEYWLSVNNGSNVWSSVESIYLQYDASAQILHFPNGSFWTMGCVSVYPEQDGGTYYPTVMEDTNGNQILITYENGIGASWPDSSARIKTIEDVRATYSSGAYSTYQFAYNSDPIPHLTSIANSIGTGEAYTFTYSGFTLVDPFTSTSFGSYTQLAGMSLTNDSPANYQMTTDTSGELTKAVLIYGGYIKWNYSSTGYDSSTVYQMEVSSRILSKDGTMGSETTYNFGHESPGANSAHSFTTIEDPGLVGEKYWGFGINGLASTYQGRDRAAGGPGNCLSGSANGLGACKIESDFTWTQDSAGNYYIGAVNTTADPGASYAKAKKTTQTVDTNGNVTQVNNYDWGSLSSPARTYNYTYLSSSPYTSRYIFNRLQSATVTPAGGSPLNLDYIVYDGATLHTPGGSAPREWDSAYTTSVTARGNPTSVTDVSYIVSTTQYDLYGNVYAAVGGSGVSSSVSTSSTTNFAAPDAITVGGSLTSSMSFSSSLGLTNETGPNGTSVSIGYDANARPASSTSPFGATTYNSYNDSSSSPSTCIIVNGRWTLTALDGLGRPLVTYTGYGISCGSGTILTQAEASYDSCGCSPLGKLITQWVPRTYGSSITNAAATTYTYDGIGRTLSKAVVGAGSTPDTQGTTSYVYQGNTVKVTDPAGKIKIFTSDAFGNLLQVVEDPSGFNYSTTYTYDVLGHLVGVSMPRSTGTQTRSWSYTGNFLMSATNAENGTVSYTYGSNNKVATRTDAKGQVAVYSYDGSARLTKVQRYPSGTGNPEDTCQQEDYYYDNNSPAGPPYPTNGMGRLSAVEYWGGFNPLTSPTCDTAFIEIYNYGVPGAPVSKQLKVSRAAATFALTATYTYDNEGRTTAETYPTDNSGTTASLSYTFDAMGRLNTMTDNIAMQTIVAGTSYGPANELTSITGASGGWAGESMGYNSLKQLTSLSSSSGLYVNYNYPSIGNNGKISSEHDGGSGVETITYTYDNLNRLIAASDQPTWYFPWGQSFSYDGFGNLTNASVTQGSAPSLSATYDSHNHAGGEDANGNPGSVPLPAYGTSALGAYDVENRLVSLGWTLTTTSPVAFYSYDPSNKRVWRGNWVYTTAWNRTQDEITFWSISGRKLATYNLTQFGTTLYATQTGTNYYFGGKLIKNASGYIYADRLGSLGQFFPYGQQRGYVPPNDTEKFTGYFRDAESGNDYAVNRYMSPGTGRFLTPDRMSGHPGDPGSWNKYAYTRGDPINRKDPGGTCDTSGDTDTSVTVCGDDDPNSDPSGVYSSDYGGDGSFENAAFLASQDSSTPCYGEGSAPSPTCIAFLAMAGIAPPGNAQGGGGDGGTATNYSVTSPQAIEVQNDLRWLQQAIVADPSCNSWLNPPLAPIDQAVGITLGLVGDAGMAAGVANLSDPLVNATQGPVFTGIPDNNQITISLDGAFFNSGASLGSFNIGGAPAPLPYAGGSAGAQAFILLHELAHLISPTGYIGNDYGDSDAERKNNTLVMQNCVGVISRAQGIF